jgi:glycosyltransferase involved in cell wall biosynthesis
MPFNGRNKGGIQGIFLRRKVNRMLNKLYESSRLIGLISFWYGEGFLLADRFAKKHKLKHFCWILGQDARPLNHFPQRFPSPPENLIALSDHLKETFHLSHGILPSRVIEPGLDLNLFTNGTTKKSIDILGVGSLIPLKQYDLFLEIIAQLKNLFPTIKVVLVGEGTERARLEKKIRQLELEQHVEMKGELPYKEVVQLMKRSYLFLHPSSYEGFSGVCMEALAAGMQVVSLCRPVKRLIVNWHFVYSKEEMKSKVIELLEVRPEAEATESFPIQNTSKRIMELFLPPGLEV